MNETHPYSLYFCSIKKTQLSCNGPEKGDRKEEDIYVRVG